MKLNFWRLMGIVWGMAIASDILWSLTYPLVSVSMPVFVIKDIVLTAAITFVFMRWYFDESPVGPSFTEGAKLGFVIFGITFAYTFVSSFVAAAVGLPPFLPYMEGLPEWYMPFQAVLVVVMVLSSAATGWYLKKYGK